MYFMIEKYTKMQRALLARYNIKTFKYTYKNKNHVILIIQCDPKV